MVFAHRLVKPIGMSLALGTDVQYGHRKYSRFKKYCTAGYVTVQHYMSKVGV